MDKPRNRSVEADQERLSEVISLKKALEYLLERSHTLEMEMTGALICSAMESVVEEVKQQIDLTDDQAEESLRTISSDTPYRIN